MKTAIIGAGLAGCECASALARAGLSCTLFEMKPTRFSPAHKSPNLAELVCSNSLRSAEPETAIGTLKLEMQSLGSLILEAALASRVAAGKALAVDREIFSRNVSAAIERQALISLVRREVPSLDDPELSGFDAVVVAAGPLASQELTESLLAAIGGQGLYFYDAIAPIVTADSIDPEKTFLASRNQPGEADYVNCPLNREEYFNFRRELLEGQKVAPREFEDQTHFEGCLPIETMAERGEMTLAFGPLKPVGLIDPKTGERPFAVIQLRAENLERSLFNLVGFQTKLTHPEQQRIFRMIPGLAEAEFVRLGSIHRNTFVEAPKVLGPNLELLARPGVYLAGQITGVEGYLESAACGLWLGQHLAAKAGGRALSKPPAETALGALLRHLEAPAKHFQPMNANFGLTPALELKAKKNLRKSLYASRAAKAWSEWLAEQGLDPQPGPNS